MARELSITVRTAVNAEHSEIVAIVLATIDHDELDTPARLSSDPTARLSADPLVYGTVHQGLVYQFVLMSVQLPDDKEDAAASVSLVFENVAADMASVARATVTPATLDLVLVTAAAPDYVEEEYRGLRIVRATYDSGRLTVEAMRADIMRRPWPAHRMTQSRFPGQFR